MENLTIEELVELFLVVLFDLSSVGEHKEYIELQEVATMLGIHDAVRVTNVAYYLAFTRAITFREVAGKSFAKINSKGIEVVKSEGTTGIIAKYRENPGTFLVGQ